MTFIPKNNKKQNTSVYKSLYIKEELVNKIEKIAKDNKTSFNNVIISMIETCLEENDEDKNNK